MTCCKCCLFCWFAYFEFFRIQLLCKFEEANKEKSATVMRYAQSEQKNIELQEKLQKADTKLKDATKEVETLKSKLKTVIAEKQKYQETLENRVNITLKLSYFCILNKVLKFLNNPCNLSLATVCI